MIDAYVTLPAPTLPRLLRIIKAHLAESEITTRDARADALGIDRTAYAELERGDRQATGPEAAAVAGYLGALGCAVQDCYGPVSIAALPAE